jgi:hypothetical protein
MSLSSNNASSNLVKVSGNDTDTSCPVIPQSVFNPINSNVKKFIAEDPIQKTQSNDTGTASYTVGPITYSSNSDTGKTSHSRKNLYNIKGNIETTAGGEEGPLVMQYLRSVLPHAGQNNFQDTHYEGNKSSLQAVNIAKPEIQLNNNDKNMVNETPDILGAQLSNNVEMRHQNASNMMFNTPDKLNSGFYYEQPLTPQTTMPFLWPPGLRSEGFQQIFSPFNFPQPMMVGARSRGYVNDIPLGLHHPQYANAYSQSSDFVTGKHGELNCFRPPLSRGMCPAGTVPLPTNEFSFKNNSYKSLSEKSQGSVNYTVPDTKDTLVKVSDNSNDEVKKSNVTLYYNILLLTSLSNYSSLGAQNKQNVDTASPKGIETITKTSLPTSEKLLSNKNERLKESVMTIPTGVNKVEDCSSELETMVPVCHSAPLIKGDLGENAHLYEKECDFFKLDQDQEIAAGSLVETNSMEVTEKTDSFKNCERKDEMNLVAMCSETEESENKELHLEKTLLCLNGKSPLVDSASNILETSGIPNCVMSDEKKIGESPNNNKISQLETDDTLKNSLEIKKFDSRDAMQNNVTETVPFSDNVNEKEKVIEPNSNGREKLKSIPKSPLFTNTLDFQVPMYSLLSLVFSFLDGCTLSRCETLCRSSRYVIRVQHCELWKNIYFYDEDDDVEPAGVASDIVNTSEFYKALWLGRHGALEYLGFKQVALELEMKRKFERMLRDSSVVLSKETEFIMRSKLRSTHQIVADLKFHVRNAQKIVRSVKALLLNFSDNEDITNVTERILQQAWAKADMIQQYRQLNQSRHLNHKHHKKSQNYKGMKREVPQVQTETVSMSNMC